MSTPAADPRPLIVALDFATLAQARECLAELDPALCRVKIGKELFTRSGPPAIEAATAAGFEVFLDLKFHDIPNTVAGAVRAAAELGVWMVNVHAGGGRAMLEAAAGAAQQCAHPPQLIAVTVLTSMDAAALSEVGVSATPESQVTRLAQLAADSGLDGVVCSPLEIAALRNTLQPDFRLVTPGVRPAGASRDDQVRVATPADALRAGADYLVVGRPITQAGDRAQALHAIAAECRV